MIYTRSMSVLFAFNLHLFFLKLYNFEIALFQVWLLDSTTLSMEGLQSTLACHTILSLTRKLPVTSLETTSMVLNMKLMAP